MSIHSDFLAMLYSHVVCKTHTIHGIFTYMLFVFMVNVGKYIIHGCHGKDEDFSSKSLSLKWFGLLESVSPKVSKVILSMPAIHLIPLRCIERHVSGNAVPPSTAARWICLSTVVMQKSSTSLWLCFLLKEEDFAQSIDDRTHPWSGFFHFAKLISTQSFLGRWAC